MAIYGVALLSICTFFGLWLGRMLGSLVGLESDVGGIGFAMIFLMLLTEYLQKKGVLDPVSESGLAFWGAMYIPVVVAMAMNQNVFAAIAGGPTAILAGVLGCGVMFPLIKPISKLAKASEDWDESANPLLKK